MSSKKDDSFDGFELNEFFPYVLTLLSEKVCSGLSEIYTQRHGLIIPEWRVLACLAEFGVLNASDIIEFTCMEKSKVSRAVKALHLKGLVIQQQTKEDGRSKILKLTRKGTLLHKKIIPEMVEWESELLKNLCTEENRALMASLRKLTESL